MKSRPVVLRQPGQHQAGSTLLMILVLLMIGSLVGLSIAQSSITDERISGNYRAVVQADMAAQAGAIDTLRRLRSPEGGASLSVTELYDYLDNQDLFLDEQELAGKTGADLWSLLVSTTGMQPIRHEDGRTEYVYGFYKDGLDIVMVLQARYIGALDQGSDDPTYAYSQPVLITLAADPRDTRGGGGGNNGSDGSGYPNPYVEAFQSAISACGSVTMPGSGRVSYYDSRNGSWNQNAIPPLDPNFFSIRALTTNNPNVDITGGKNVYGGVKVLGNVTVRSAVYGSVFANGNVTIDGGNAAVHLDVRNRGNLTLSGSSKIHGNAYSGGNLNITAGSTEIKQNAYIVGTTNISSGKILQNLYSNGTITLNSGGEVLGNAFTQGNVIINNGRFRSSVRALGDIEFNQWNDTARIYGGLTLGGSVKKFNNNPWCSSSGHVTGSPCIERSTGLSIEAQVAPAALEPVEVCDLPMFAGSTISQYTGTLRNQLGAFNNLVVSPWPYNEWFINGNDLKKQHKQTGVVETHQSSLPADFMGEKVRFFYFKDLEIKNDGSGTAFSIPDGSGNVYIYVDGDLKLGTGGSNNHIRIGKDSSLTFVVSGRTSIGGGFRMANSEALNESGRPFLSIFSSFSGSNGVVLDGAATVSAYIYAPNADIRVTAGGTLLGAVYGRNVDASGNGNIVFDLALLEAEFGGGSSGGNPGNGGSTGGNKAITNWR